MFRWRRAAWDAALFLIDFMTTDPDVAAISPHSGCVGRHGAEARNEKKSMLLARTLLAVVFALPVAVLAIRAVTQDLKELSDPCVAWGASDSGDFGDGFHHRGEAPCTQWSSHNETRTWAVTRMVAFPGLILLAAVLGICAVACSLRRMTFIAAILMLSEAAPLAIGLWGMLVALLAGGGFLYTGYRIWNEERHSAPTP